jgi:HSP20 family protein
MARLVPFNRKNNLSTTNTGFDDFFNTLDDFFTDSWLPSRSLSRDTFKIDIEETDSAYLVEAELPGVKKEELELNADQESLCISVNRAQQVNKDGKNYIHRERHASSMSRRIRLVDANLDGIKAKLNDGVLRVTIPKDEKANSLRKIDID